MSQPYVPFGLTEEEAEVRRVLVDGVPSWMWSSLHAWIAERIDYGTRHTMADLSKLRELQNACALPLRIQAIGDSVSMSEAMNQIVNLKPFLVLRIVDYFLSKTGYEKSGYVVKMESILSAGSSKWTVANIDGRMRLTERIPSGVQDAAEALITQGNVAGNLLGQAWTKVHQLEPDDSGAYAYAVRAVEAASFPALGITDGEATLGTAIRAIESRKWGLPFKREHFKAPSEEVLLGLLRALWRGHRDRHGSVDYSDVEHDEAVAAVILAVTLVGWFEMGAVQERHAEPAEGSGA